MKFARIINDEAVEVVDFNPAERFHPDVAVLFEAVPDSVNQGATRNGRGEWIPYVAPEIVVPDPTPEPDPVPGPTEWLIDIGPFMDRFGMLKMAVLTSQDVTVKAIIQDMYGRKWLDLKRADVTAGINAIAAVVTSITPALTNAILTTPIAPEENMALRKLYFN